MKNLKPEDQNELNNWTTPDQLLSHDEFMYGIAKAEEGPFFTVQESMENFERWMKSKEKK